MFGSEKIESLELKADDVERRLSDLDGLMDKLADRVEELEAQTVDFEAFAVREFAVRLAKRKTADIVKAKFCGLGADGSLYFYNLIIDGQPIVSLAFSAGLWAEVTEVLPAEGVYGE